MAEHVPTRSCDLFRPGHNVHLSQWRESVDGAWRSVKLLTREDMICVVEIDGSQETWRFHDIERYREILSAWKPGQAADFSDFGALRIGNSFLYPCRRPEDWTDCKVLAAAPPGEVPATRAVRDTREMGGG